MCKETTPGSQKRCDRIPVLNYYLVPSVLFYDLCTRYSFHEFLMSSGGFGLFWFRLKFQIAFVF